MKDALANLPITDNIAIQSINMTADVANGYLTANNFAIVMTGTDSSSKSHTVELNVDVAISDINNTSVTAIDTTGKNVTETQDNERD